MTRILDTVTPSLSHPSLAEAATLAAKYAEAPADAILRFALLERFRGDIAVVSSFGAESAVLLHLVAAVAPDTPVLFLETDRHFFQTLSYRKALAAKLGLTRVIDLHPDTSEVSEQDPKGNLSSTHPDACCDLRKVRPLARGLAPYGAWISGRKRHQADTRAALPVFEHDGQHFKINPLAAWTPADLAAYAERHALPAHPLVEQGYPSIGCFPCTQPASAEDPRAGRWAGQAKTECGIHTPTPVSRPRPL